MNDPKQLAKALIGVKGLPDGLSVLKSSSAEAWAYHKLKPYPLYHFQSWMKEDRGPLPRCLPIARRIVKRGAKFLFGKPVIINCAGNDKWETFVREVWTANGMPARLVPMAEHGALESGVVLKFAWDKASDPKLSIQSLSPVSEVRLFYNPHNRTQLLMARVQYPYWDAVAGKTYWYREEWTDEEEVHYKPISAEMLQNSRFDPDTFDGWERDEEASQANPFKLIPLQYIKNQETDDTFGALELDDLYRVLDNVHLTFHLMNQSNQFDSQINPVFIDADMDDEDIDKPIQPAQPIELHSKEGENTHQAKVHELGGANTLRPAMMEYARELIRQVEDAASTVNVNQAEFTNKGNLTTAVLQQLYQPQIELTEEKRKSWGTDGIVLFLERAAKGLANIGAREYGIDLSNKDTYSIELKWPAFFTLSEDEKTAKVGRIQEEEVAGYVTHDRAIEEIAQIEEREDVKQLKDDLAKEPRPTATEADPSLQNMETEIKGLTRVAGPEGQ